jgi:hypothetical protein
VLCWWIGGTIGLLANSDGENVVRPLVGLTPFRASAVRRIPLLRAVSTWFSRPAVDALAFKERLFRRKRVSEFKGWNILK